MHSTLYKKRLLICSWGMGDIRTKFKFDRKNFCNSFCSIYTHIDSHRNSSAQALFQTHISLARDRALSAKHSIRGVVEITYIQFNKEMVQHCPQKQWWMIWCTIFKFSFLRSNWLNLLLKTLSKWINLIIILIQWLQILSS